MRKYFRAVWLQYAGIFGLASRIASPIYKALPEDLRGRWVFQTIAGNAASLLYKGKTKEEVNDILWKKYIVEPEPGSEETVAATATTGSRKTGNQSCHWNGYFINAGKSRERQRKILNRHGKSRKTGISSRK